LRRDLGREKQGVIRSEWFAWNQLSTRDPEINVNVDEEINIQRNVEFVLILWLERQRNL
jgi:hypothetical protein